MASVLNKMFAKNLHNDEKMEEYRMLYVNQHSSEPVDIEFTKINLTVSEGFRSRKKKTILNGVSGSFKSGQVTAIMGPSGAGKSSLLNALTGFCTKGVTGTIKAGNNVYEFSKNQKSIRSLKAYRKKSCYIMQDDRLHPCFTVAEVMKFAANVKLGNILTVRMKQSVIFDVLETLGLLDTANTRCDSLSGGQRKRLSIALEMIDNPPVLFLDEPTTGLDCLATVQCIKMLKELARTGRTIVCSIHQPPASVYMMFDQVYILANGICIYQGFGENTVPFLASVGLQCPKYHNPADYIIEIANGEHGDLNGTLSEACARQDACKELMSRTVTPSQTHENKIPYRTSVLLSSPNELYRFRVLVQRCFIQQYRDWTVVHMKVAVHLFLGTLLGLLFYRAGDDASQTVSNVGFLISSMLLLSYTSLMPAVFTFPVEISILKKENFNNWYNLRTHYAAVLVTTIPVQICFCFAYTTPAYFLSGQPTEFSRFAMFMLVLIIVSVTADAVGTIIGTSVNPVNGFFLGSILYCTMLAVSGSMALLKDMLPVMRIISYFSLLRYCFEAIVLSIYGNNRPPMRCPEHRIYCHMRYPKDIIDDTLHFSADNFWRNIIILSIVLVVLKTLGYFSLRRSIKQRTD